MPKRILLSAILGAALVGSAPSNACERFEHKIEHYTNLRRAGGSASQMTRWQKARHRYQDRYQECRRNRSRIQSYRRPRGPSPKPDYQKPRKITGSDARTRTLERTCNFWISEYNRMPSPAHREFRETACNAAQQAKREPRPATSPKGRPEKQLVRPLGECIKSEHEIDADVLACMRGERPPDWRGERLDATQSRPDNSQTRSNPNRGRIPS